MESGRDVVKLCTDLVSINTVDSMNAREVERTISDYISAVAPFSIHEFESNGVRNFLMLSEKAEESFREEGKIPVLFNGHYDVVPAADWDNAFNPEIRDGRIYGRGSGDMKAGLAAMVDAFSVLASQGLPVGLMVVGDEEKGGLNGTAHVLDETGITADRVFVGEPSSSSSFGDTIKNGRRGVFQFRLSITGKGGHAARPGQARNPAIAVARAVMFAESFGFANDSSMVPTTVSVTSIEMGGKAANVIPAKATMTFDMRYNISTDPEAFLSALEKELSGHGYSVDAERIAESRPFRNPDREFERELVEVMEGEGYSPGFSTSGGSSDARFFSARGMPVLELGTRGRNAHARHEHAFAEDIPRLSSVLVAYVRHFLGK